MSFARYAPFCDAHCGAAGHALFRGCFELLPGPGPPLPASWPFRAARGRASALAARNRFWFYAALLSRSAYAQ